MAHRILYENMDLEAALKAACDDLSIKERYFITPTALISAQRGNRDNRDHRVTGTVKEHRDNRWIPRGGPKRNQTHDKGGKKGSGKKGNGKHKDNKGEVRKNSFDKKYKNNKTPDGRLLRWAFQSEDCKFVNNCKFVHACANCLGDHPACNKTLCKAS